MVAPFRKSLTLLVKGTRYTSPKGLTAAYQGDDDCRRLPSVVQTGGLGMHG